MRNFITASFILVLSAIAFGSTEFTYQGQLKDTSGPVTGNYNLSFKLYNALTGGSQQGTTQTFNTTAITNGLFTLNIDFGNQYDGTDRWMEISVNGTPLSPRQKITAEPYAIFSQNTRGIYVDPTGLVGIGTASPFNQLDVTGTVNVVGAASGVTATASGFSGIGVSGKALTTTGNGIGVLGEGMGSLGIGVVGVNSSPSGLTNGVQGAVNSTIGYGVLGRANSTTGQNYGVLGISSSNQGFGTGGINTAASGSTTGVYGESRSPAGYAIYAVTTATTGLNYGIYSTNKSSGGIGIYGEAQSISGTAHGVEGYTFNLNGAGVIGKSAAASGPGAGVAGFSASNSGTGVYGVASSISGTTYGVYGECSNSLSYGVYASGALGASGTKTFRIDHPSDPKNKYLLHYSSEGPEPLNIYSGNITTDSQGIAWVILPDYFDKINKDFRYQLTVVDDSSSADFVQVKVMKKISANRFAIRTSKPNIEVSWRVEAVRNDLWVQKYGAPVEINKDGYEKGKYQHPELYNQPPQEGMNFRPMKDPSASNDKTHK